MSKKELDIFDYLLEENEQSQKNGAETINSLDEERFWQYKRWRKKKGQRENRALRLKEPNRNKHSRHLRKSKKIIKEAENDAIIRIINCEA
ncbi:hypothetical protein HFP67_30800 [Bacillus sp. CB102A.1]